LLIAERPAPTGAYDFTALAREGVGRVLHYQQVPPVQADQPVATGGPAVVNVLQGNALDAVWPANVPPFQTYFADYDDQFADAAARGHMGDIAIWRVCGAGTGTQALVPTFPAPSLLVPVGFCRRGEIRLPGGECCDRRFVRYGRCGCPPGAVRRDPPAGWPVLRPAPGPQRSVLRARRDRMRRDAVPERSGHGGWPLLRAAGDP